MFRNPVTDLIVVLVVALLIFGPKRLPMLGRSLGQGLREFKDSITGNSTDEEQPALNAAQAAPSQAATTPPREEAAVASPAPAPDPPASAASGAPAPAAPTRESAEVGSSESSS